MIVGTLFFDKTFVFKDGELGEKIFVTLGTAFGVTIVVKTTSRGTRFLNDFGCQIEHRFPNFHLVKGCYCLDKPTWIVLGEFYEFNDVQLLQKHFSQDVSRIGVLPDEITANLLECAIKSEDISAHQRYIVSEALK